MLWWRSFFGNLATDHFSIKFFSKIASSGYAGLMIPVSSMSPGVHSMEGQTHRIRII
jgi:hypothetical protein